MNTRRILVCLIALSFCPAGCENKSTESKPTAADAQTANATPEQSATDAEFLDEMGKELAGQRRQIAPQTPPPAPPVTPASGGPQWQLTNDTIDFGTVWAGVEVLKNFTYRNVGGQPLDIIEIKPHCSCSAAENYTKQVPPGGEGIVPFRLKTNNKQGPVREYLDITTNDPARRIMRVWLSGNVMQVCTVEVVEDSLYEKLRAEGRAPAAFPTRSKGNFGRIEKDDVLRRVVKLINTSGVEPLKLQMLPLPANSRFSVEMTETIPGQEYAMTIVGHGPFPEGYTTMAVQLRTNVPEQPFYQVPISANVPPRIEVRPPKIVIDRKLIKATERLIRIINNGTAPLHITGLECTDPRFNLEMMPGAYDETKSYNFKMIVPGEDYVPPPYGEIIRIHTDDAEKKVIEILVLPSLRANPTPRPADKPATFYPGKMQP